MSLLDNAYDSVNESLRLGQRAETSERAWKFAILNLVHYEFELFINDIESIYALLFEFAHSFHQNHLGGEFHQHIEEQLWHKEASLMEYFRQTFVTYRGRDTIAYWPRRIIETQDLQTITTEGVEYPRIRWGEEKAPMTFRITLAGLVTTVLSIEDNTTCQRAA
jgi:hypothetical protein